MTILYHKGDELKPIVYPFAHDPQDKKFYRLRLRPPQWATSVVYVQGRDEVVPTTFNGFSYPVTSGGTGSASEPTWPVIKGDEVTDNSQVTFKAVPYDFLMETGDTLTAGTWTGDDDVTLDNEGFSAEEVFIRVTAVPSAATTMTITCHITITRANADIEEFDISLKVKIKTL